MSTTLQTPTEYIQHHLKHLSWSPNPDSPFWYWHLDSLVISFVLGFFVFALPCALLARRARVAAPSGVQIFVEWILEMVDTQVKQVFHGKNQLIAPLALTVFIWVVLMNTMDLIPVDALPLLGQQIDLHYLRVVPTADVNLTLAMSLSVILLCFALGIQAKGIGGFAKELLTTPFHTSHPLAATILAPLNLTMQSIEYVSRGLSLALRLFGNMFAGELVFMLIALLPWWGQVLPGFLWAVFHILIVILQAYIFMMLTIVYCGLAVESH